MEEFVTEQYPLLFVSTIYYAVYAFLSLPICINL